jgi:hypothetical protein
VTVRILPRRQASAEFSDGCVRSPATASVSLSQLLAAGLEAVGDSSGGVAHGTPAGRIRAGVLLKLGLKASDGEIDERLARWRNHGKQARPSRTACES